MERVCAFTCHASTGATRTTAAEYAVRSIVSSHQARLYVAQRLARTEGGRRGGGRFRPRQGQTAGPPPRPRYMPPTKTGGWSNARVSGRSLRSDAGRRRAGSGANAASRHDPRRRQDRHRRRPLHHRRGAGDPRPAHRRGRYQRRDREAQGTADAHHRARRPHRHSRPDRQPFALGARRRAQRAALRWRHRAQARGRAAHRTRAGRYSPANGLRCSAAGRKNSSPTRSADFARRARHDRAERSGGAAVGL